jgi:hypothetical protein
MAKGPTFTRYTRAGDIAHGIATSTQAAWQWFRSAVQRLSGVNIMAEIEEGQVVTQEEAVQKAIKTKLLKPVDHTNIGQMFLFKYDPKWKQRLPYWDVYPLVFPIDVFTNGFVGINLHYLPFGFRDPILNHLSALSNDSDKYDDEGRLQISYDILKSYSLMFNRFYKDCVRKYLYDHVRSQFQYVNPKDWHNVAAMPFERWEYRK